MWRRVLLWTIFFGCGNLAQSIKVSVYYETLCPYSVRFIVDQLYPVYREHSNHLEVDLIPYGKANTTYDAGAWEFECQHGEAECYGNKVHSCAIGLYPVSQSTEFVYCAMNSGNASADANLEECATSTNIPWTTLQECLSSGQGDELLAANGRRTDPVIPVLINSVPTIIFNDAFHIQLRSLGINDFQNTFLFLHEQIQCDFCLFNEGNVVFSSGKFVFGVTLLLMMVQKFTGW